MNDDSPIREEFPITMDDFVYDEYLRERFLDAIDLEYGTSPDENIYFKGPKNFYVV